MVVSFPSINETDYVLILKNLDGTEIQTLGYAHNVVLDLSYNEVSSISFDLPNQVDGNKTPGYSSVVGMKTVDLLGVGQFILVDPVERDDGIVKVKSCKGYSLEYEFAKKEIYIEEGTFNFFDGISTSNPDTVIGRIVEVMPEWSFNIDTSLIGVYRTFGDTSKKVYDFIKSDVQQTYGCIFNFNTYTRVVNVRAVSSIVPTHGVFLSSENLIKQIDINEDSDNIITCLDVSGAEGVNIRNVNPTGTNKIYNLDYFMTTDNFSQSLINKWRAWEAACEAQRQNYTNAVNLYNMRVMESVVEQSKLTELNNDLIVLQNQQAVIIQAIAIDQSTQSQLNTINSQIAAKQNEITAQQTKLDNIETQKATLLQTIRSINSSLAMDAQSGGTYTYFTPAELQILRRYFIEDSFEDSSFVVSEVASYDSTDFGTDLTNFRTIFSGGTLTTVTASGKTLYDYNAGSFSLQAGTTISAESVHATLEADTTNRTYVLSAHLANGTVGSAEFTSSNFTAVGTYSALTVNTGINMLSTTGRIYFTKDSTDYEQTKVELELLEYGKQVLAEKASPTYTFEVESANFLRLDEFASFKNELTLGERVYLKIDDEVLEPYVVGVHIEFENPSGFSVTFSNSYTGFDSSFALSRLLEQSVSMGKTLNSKAGQYASFVNSGASSSVREFMNSALDIAKNAVLSSGHQAISYDDSGMRIRKWKTDASGNYILDSNGNRVLEPEEIWIVDNTIAFTDDSWATAKMAIGKIFNPNRVTYRQTTDTSRVVGKTYYTDQNGTVWNGSSPAWSRNLYEIDNDGIQYGIAAPYIVGQIVASEQLQVTNTSGSFYMDESGVHVNGANFYITYPNSSTETIADALSDAGVSTFYQATVPTGVRSGDLWFNTSTSNVSSGGVTYTAKKWYRYNGSSWNLVEDGSISTLTSGLSTANSNITTINNKLSNVINSNGTLKAPQLSGLISAQAAQMSAAGGNVLFDNQGLWLLNTASKSTATKAVWMNNQGIMIGTGTASSNPASNFTWKTAISANGIVADAIAAGTLSSMTIVGGSINIGTKSGNYYPFMVDSNGNLKIGANSSYPNGKFYVSNSGDLTANSGTFKGTLDAASVSGKLKGNGSSWLIGSGLAIGGTLSTITNTPSSANFFVNTDGSMRIGGSSSPKFQVDSSGNVTMSGSINLSSGNVSWSSSSSPMKAQYSANGTSNWHTTLAATDYYARYSYDGGTTWTAAILVRGKNGEDGDDAEVPEYIFDTYIDMTSVTSPYVIGGLVYATGQGALNQPAFYISNGVTTSGGVRRPNSPVGWLSYDTNGSGEGQATNRVFLHTTSGTALKIDAGGNISIGAGTGNGSSPSLPSTGGSGHIFLQAAPVLQYNVSYGTALPSTSGKQMRNGQLFFVID